MKKASLSVKTFVSKLNGAKRVLGTFSGQLAAVASVGGLVAFVKSSAEAYDAIGELSDRLGASVEEMQRLQYAADLTGSSAEMLSAGLQTLAKRLGEAARGGGAARAALLELGLDAKKLSAMSPVQAFYEIADAMEEIVEPGKRSAIAANLFSKANMQLLSTLDAGREGLKRFGKELGTVLSRSEIAKIENFNDQLTRLKNNLRPIGGKIAGSIADAVEYLYGKPEGIVEAPPKSRPEIWSRSKTLLTTTLADWQPSLNALRNTFVTSAALFANRLKTEWDYFAASGMQPPWGGKQKVSFSLTGAYERGSAGAYSIIANTQGTLLQEAKRRRRILEQIRDKQEDQEVVEIAP